MTETTRPRLARPTESEVRVLDKLILGLDNYMIAKQLGLSVQTVKTHLKRASTDTRALNRTHLAVIYTGWKYGGWDNKNWDARRREHPTACSIFRDDTCDCQARRDPTEDRRLTEG